MAVGCAFAPHHTSTAAPLVVAPNSAPKAAPIGAESVSVIVPDWRSALLKDWKTPPTFGTIQASEGGLKLITTVQPEKIYNLEARLLNQIPLAKGDTMMIRFAARSLVADKATGVTKLRVGFSKASPDWDSSYRGELGLTSNWQRYDIPFTCKNDFATGEARVIFTFGFPAQQLEVADLQVLKFGPQVSVASLPKTKRFADKWAPEIVQAELERIARMKAELDAVKDPSPANGKVIYVAKTGSATGNGTKNAPFATIPQALEQVQPGDTVEVGAGEYIEPKGVSFKKSGRPNAWIHLRAAAGKRPKLVTSGWSGIEFRGGISYVEVEGFELQWVENPEVTKENGAPIHGSGIAPMYGSHHIRILNNIVHGYGTGGIVSLDCDYLHIEGNTVYNTAKTSPYGGSAISLCRAFNFDEKPGYHNVVRGNICYDNELKVVVLETSGGNGRTLTDGNGIIIDVFNRSRKNPLIPHQQDREGPLEAYRHRTLVENNLLFDNGGRGIHAFRSSRVDILNNTTYLNQKSADINAGELTAIESNEVVLANNISYGQKAKRINNQDGSTKVIWLNNLLAGSDDALLHDGLLQADPQFVAPALNANPEGFRLQATSPARGKALKIVAPSVDVLGKPRPAQSAADLGAF